ncbi:beta-propeller domain-containing protein [Candidatus Peregrinibacteria bacterium]|nr:beta-propeller domain-containing protein [Candidatus Peregrinibacteria bacterium]
MRSPRTRLCLLLSILTLANAIPLLASAASFTDVNASTSYATAIGALKTKGVLTGYSNGMFKPKQTINRAEFLKIALQGRGTTQTSGTPDECFTDVKGQWFATLVCQAKDEGVIEGYPDGLFHPERLISFVEAGKILALGYHQKIRTTSSDWYEPYARALESAKAIPPSIRSLTHLVTRGEMAEMMWRLSQKKTDQPSIGYLNVKYPDTNVNFASDTVQTAKSCEDLSAFAQESTNVNQGGYPMLGVSMAKGHAVAAPMAAGMDRMAETQSNADYSKTNVQVEGVDEGDIVKTDGTRIYTISNKTVHVVQAQPATAMKKLATIDYTNQQFTPSDLYVNGSTLVVLGQSWDAEPMPKMIPGMIMRPIRNTQTSMARLYDIADAAHPKEVRTLAFDGSTVSTRLIGSRLLLVVQQPMMYWSMPLNVDVSTLVPQMRDSLTGSTEIPIAPCTAVTILPHVPSPAYLTVASVPLDDRNGEVKRSVILGDGQNVYASLKNLYVATTQWQYNWNAVNPQSSEQTVVYRFALHDGALAFAAQGSVPGHILNQFSMDENADTFRIATTRQTTISNETQQTNDLFVLGMDLQQLGSVTDIAPGESIYAVRFLGDRAYVVTFKSIDPLFVIDTSDAKNPKILGRLSIPGYSNYLHPYDATHLIGFGKDVDESIDKEKIHSNNAVYYTAVQGMKLALFDVSDVSNPKEMSHVVIGNRGTDSPLLTDHKALLFDKERGLMSFPITVMKVPENQKSSDPSGISASPVFQGAYVYGVDLQRGFTLKGTITQYDASTFQKAGQYWYGGPNDIQRILRIGDSLYTVSQGAVQSNGLNSLTKEGRVDFPTSATNSPVEYFSRGLR